MGLMDASLFIRYEMCCDMVDVMLDISSIYGYPSDSDVANGAAANAAAIGQ